MKIERHFEDISFFVVMEGKESDGRVIYVQFQAYEVVGKAEDNNIWIYSKADALGDFTTKLDKSKAYLSGSIKGDGCSNMNFDEQEKGMLHFCGKQDAQNIGVLLGRLYDMAAEIMPDSKEDLQ